MDVRSFGHGGGDGVLSQLFSVLLILMKSNFNIAPELIEKKLYFSVFTWVLYQDYMNFFEAGAEAQGGGGRWLG